MSVRRCLGVSLSLLLTGCAVGPDYETPATEAPRSFAQADKDRYRGDGVEVRWWRQFKDSELERLIAWAINHNRDLRAAEANLQQARALYRDAAFDLLPTVTARGTYTDTVRSFDSLNRRAFVPRGLSLYNIGFDATWELDFFGRIRRGIEAREAEVEGAEAGRRDLIVSLIAEVARNYFELRGLQEQRATAERNAENQRATLDLTRERLNAGIGTELDTARAEAQYQATRAVLPPIEARIAQSIHRIGVLTGDPPEAPLKRLSKPQPLPALPVQVRIGSPAELLRRRADVRGAERTLAASTAQIGVATADLFPRVVFNGTLSLEAKDLGGLGAAASDAHSFGPRITWAALDLGQVRARIQAADARAEADLARYEQAVLSALEDTENALAGYQQERERADRLAAAAAASEQAYRLAHLRFDEGVTDFLTVLDSERRLLEDQGQLAVSRTATVTSLIALFKALGGGWEAFVESTEPH